MRIIRVSNIEKFAAEVTPKPSLRSKTAAESIFRNVKRNGDAAIKRYEKKFTGANLTSLRVSKSEIKDAYCKVSKSELAALRLVKSRLEMTERAIMSSLKDTVSEYNEIKISKSFVPLKSVGCYVPGGLARYPSSAVMSVIPAKVAGVRRVIVVSPPDSHGDADPLTVVAADMCGADEIYKTGGAQSIAALSFGTKSIPKVDKIVGPGGAFVTSAKFLASEIVDIDMLAGPTELGIIADDSANPTFVALDLISQAEHGADTFCYLITTSMRLARAVNRIVSELIPNITRAKLVKSSLAKNGFIAVCGTIQNMADLANELAPEHLEIMTRDPAKMGSKITSAGLVLLGEYTPSSASDYILGSNHILPTSGFGRVRGSLSALDFVKVNTQVIATQSSLSRISKHLDVLAKAEGLLNHYEAVRGRIS